MTVGRGPLITLLGRLGERVKQEGLAAANGLGERTLTMADDVHIAPSDPRLSAFAFHRRHEPERIEVTLHLGSVGDQDRRDLDAALGKGAELPRPPDAIGQRYVRYRPRGNDHDELPGTWIAIRDRRDQVIAVSVEVLAE